MNNDCKKYLRELKTLLPTAGNYEKQFIQNIKNDLDEFLLSHPTADYDMICEYFGRPQEIIIDYFENVDTEYLIRRLNISSLIKKCVIVALLLVILVCSIKSGLYYKSYKQVQEHQVEYWIETIE